MDTVSVLIGYPIPIPPIPFLLPFPAPLPPLLPLLLPFLRFFLFSSPSLLPFLCSFLFSSPSSSPSSCLPPLSSQNRDDKLYREKVIGHVTECQHSSLHEFAKLGNLKQAHFKWQRGRKLGT